MYLEVKEGMTRRVWSGTRPNNTASCVGLELRPCEAVRPTSFIVGAILLAHVVGLLPAVPISSPRKDGCNPLVWLVCEVFIHLGSKTSPGSSVFAAFAKSSAREHGYILDIANRLFSLM